MNDLGYKQKDYKKLKQHDLEELRVDEVNTLNGWEVEAMKGERNFIENLIHYKQMLDGEIDHPDSRGFTQSSMRRSLRGSRMSRHRASYHRQNKTVEHREFRLDENPATFEVIANPRKVEVVEVEKKKPVEDPW